MRLTSSKAALAAFPVLFVFLMSATASAQSNYYVSTNGDDNRGNGSRNSPWATIAFASKHANPGDTVLVAAGVYYGSFDTYASGTASAYINYVATSADFTAAVRCARVVANHGDVSNCVRLIGTTDETWVNSGDFVTIQGFDITGRGINGIATVANATWIIGNHVHDMVTDRCNANGGSGINLDGTNARVTGNYVHHIGPFPSPCGYIHGIYFVREGGAAFNNISFANSGFGIQLWHSPSHIALVNNTIFNNATGGIVLGTDDDFLVDKITVSNNLVVHNGGVGIEEQGWSPVIMGTHNIYSHNLVTGNSGGGIVLFNGLTAFATVADPPGFVNDTGDSNGDYHLQSTSPAVKSATSGCSSNDFDGVTRPQNGACGIGAYAYDSSH